MANTESNQNRKKSGREVTVIAIIAALTIIIVVIINNIFGVLDSFLSSSPENQITSTTQASIDYPTETIAAPINTEGVVILTTAAEDALIGPTITQAPISVPTNTFASSRPPGAYVWFTWPYEENYNFDIDVTPNYTENDHIIFWAHQFHFVNGDGGYMGLQVVEDQHKIIFSIWNALDGSDGCQTFSHEGSGWQCLVDYDWQVGETYLLRIWVTEQDDAGNQWWLAAVYEYSSGEEVIVGSILVDASWGYLTASSVTWVEYAGYQRCDVPTSYAVWSNPFARNSLGDGNPVQATIAYGLSDCPLSNVFLSFSTDLVFDIHMDAGIGIIRETRDGDLLWP